MNGSEARVDLVLIQTSQLLSCECTLLTSEQLVLHNKRSEVCIKTRSTLASLPSKGQVTKQTTVKWSIRTSCFIGLSKHSKTVFSCLETPMKHSHSFLKYYIKHSGHLRTLEKSRTHSPVARVFYISLVFSNARRVLSQCNKRLSLLYLLDII